MVSACADPFSMDDLYEEARSAAPYADLAWEDFEAVVDFVATGGYALRAYERFAKIVGPERVIASTDCGLGGRVHPDIAWAKLESLGEGARLAAARV